MHCSGLLSLPLRQESASGQREKQEVDTEVERTAATLHLPPQEKLPPVKSGRLGWGGFWSEEKGGWESSLVEVGQVVLSPGKCSDTTQHFSIVTPLWPP